MNERRVKIAVESAGAEQGLIIRVESKGWLARRKTELHVDSFGLTATGDWGGHRPGVWRISWDMLAELHYGPAGMGMVEGLYAREGMWCSRCVLPRLNETEAEEVIAEVARQYPGKLRGYENAQVESIAEAPARRWRWRPGWGRRHDAVRAAAGMGGPA